MNIINKSKNNTSKSNSNNINVIISRTNGSQACAACKYQRRKCASDCILAPYFPHDRQRQFINAHKLFGVSNITKTIRHLSPADKDEAMRTIIFESDVRAMDPVGGCYRIIRQLQRQIEHSQAELDLVLHHLAYCRAQAQAASNNNHDIDCGSGGDNNNSDWYEQTYQHRNHHQLPPQCYIQHCSGSLDDNSNNNNNISNNDNDNSNNNVVAWGLHARDDSTSMAVPASQISNEINEGCDSMKPILDLSGYVEDLNFGPEETLEESDEVIVKDHQDKVALNEEDESLSNMLKIMI